MTVFLIWLIKNKKIAAVLYSATSIEVWFLLASLLMDVVILVRISTSLCCVRQSALFFPILSVLYLLLILYVYKTFLKCVINCVRFHELYFCFYCVTFDIIVLVCHSTRLNNMLHLGEWKVTTRNGNTSRLFDQKWKTFKGK